MAQLILKTGLTLKSFCEVYFVHKTVWE